MSGKSRSRWRALLAGVLINFVSAANTAAQSPAITSAPSLVAAGPDYATDVLANAWDFSDALDLSPFPDELAGWTISGSSARTIGRSAFLSAGRFAGHTALGGNDLIPMLYRGGIGVDPISETTGIFDHKAIPTARYGRLSVSLTLSASTAGQLIAFWYSGPYGFEQARGAAFSTPRAGTHIYTVDLVTGTWHDLRGNAVGPAFVPAGNYAQIAWNGTPLMRGFQIRPTSDGNASIGVQADWVRITQRDGLAGAATLPITFSGCPSRPYNVEVDAGGGSWDIIHVGTSSGSSTTTAAVNYGVLPPGSWRFRVTCYSTTRAGASASSAPVTITINHPPVPAVFDPDVTGGQDFATAVLGNPWDWNALSDAALIGGFTNPTITNDGVTNALQGSGTGGDPAVFLLFGNANVDTTRYRMLTFADTLDTPFGLNGALGEGAVARVFWERAVGASSALTFTRDILVWPGRNAYTFDLASLSSANGGIDPSCAGCLPWHATPTVRVLRIDPHEATRSTTFRLGRVTLTAFDEVRLGTTFAIQYGFVDADSGAYQARIYIDNDLEPTSKALVETIGAGITPNSTLTYSFDPAGKGVPAGLYYIYVEIVETRGGVTDVRGAYSAGPLVVSSGIAGPLPPGPPSLTAVQTAVNPVTVAWSAGAGGAPTSYTICAGTTPGGTQFGCFNLGLVTRITANVPTGTAIYARVIASNAVGSAVSNEIGFIVGGGGPGPPTMNPPIVSGRTVSLSWSPSSSGPAPTSYILVARFPGNPTPIATFQLAATGATFPGVPPGNYIVTVIAANAAGISPESNPVLVTVR
jgi:hypothetical protein